jgi:hypothetical protein
MPLPECARVRWSLWAEWLDKSEVSLYNLLWLVEGAVEAVNIRIMGLRRSVHRIVYGVELWKRGV